MSSLRVILHCDLDCFYAQVERERLGLPQDAAIAVVQWSMCLAVSYPARKYGISRGFSIDDIRKAAGDAVTIVPVETIGGGAESGPNHAHAEAVQANEKVSLARYREASSEVFAAMAYVSTGYNATLERASIDEAYIDVTAEVDHRVRCENGERQQPADTEIVGNKLDMLNEVDLRLAYGADIAREIRQQVLQKCNYTVSAGISFNKLLAKFASAKNKPNKQTILPLAAVSELMAEVPVRKLRGLGGKLGRKIEDLGIQTAGEATKFDMVTLEKKLGSQKAAEFVYKCVRGIDESEVVEREATKSLLAAKSFKAENSLETIEKQWLPLLSEELNNRMIADSDTNNRDARTLTVSFRVRMAGGHTRLNASRSTAMPQASCQRRVDAIIAAALMMLKNAMFKEGHFAFPISFIGLTATNFLARAERGGSIKDYFASASSNSDQNPHPHERMEERSEAERDEEHRRLLQERADRMLALKLHRAESSQGMKKPGLKISKGVKKGSGSTRSKVKTGMTTVDMFFKAKNQKT
ncbi:DNA polymerase Y-family [Gracilaria domingensis]|nr:DNA polymerase Y-family [Gracilaria domingensis]